MAFRLLQQTILSQLKEYNKIESIGNVIKQVGNELFPHVKGDIIRPEDEHLFRFTKNKESIIQHRIEGWILSQNMEKHHLETKMARNKQRSYEMGVNKYFIEFLHLLNDDIQGNWNRIGHFQRLIKVWNEIVSDHLAANLNDRDIGLLIKRVLFMNKILNTKERITIGLKEINTSLFIQILKLKYHVSNKELFMLLKLPMSKEMNEIKMQFYNGHLEQNKSLPLEFYLSFLEMNIPTSYMDFNFKNLDFINRVIIDFNNTKIKPDRLMLNLMMKAYAKNYIVTKDPNELNKMHNLLIDAIHNYSLSNDMINYFVACALNTNDLEMLQLMISIYRDLFQCSFESIDTQEELNIDQTRFKLRIMDAMIDKCKELNIKIPQAQNDVIGVIHRLSVNTAPYYMIKYHLRRHDTFPLLTREQKDNILLELEEIGPLIEAYKAEQINARVGNGHNGDLLNADKVNMTLDEQFESGDFGAEAVAKEESQREFEERRSNI